MEALSKVKKNAKRIYEKHKGYLPDVPRIPLVEATTVPAKSLFAPHEFEAGGTITSEPIYLQTGTDETHSFAVDLSGLHEQIVFSVVMSTSNDLVGRKRSTILVRNGVTATAARKLAGKDTVWFYHGKPMNGGDMRLHVTIGRDQMTFAYYEDGDDRLYVHGDCPVSLLTADHIGDVKGVPFYVHIYTSDKTKHTPSFKGPVTLRVLDIDGKGYIHESVGRNKPEDSESELVQPDETDSGQSVEPGAQDSGLASELADMALR
jgi:hypothetical protein